MPDYNAATWTANDLLADVFRACRLPSGGTIDYTPDVVLSMATQSLHDWAGHMMSTAHEGRNATTWLRSVTSDSTDVAGRSYELPSMAIADALIALLWHDPISNAEIRLELVPAAMLPLFTQNRDSGTPSGYAFMDGTVTVYPRPNDVGTLKMLYQRRHGQLIAQASAALAVAPGVGGASTVITMPAITSFMAVGNWCDLIASSYPYRFKVHAAHILSVADPDVEVDVPFADAAKLDLVGATMVAYGQTPFIHLPMEFREPFTRQVSSRLLSEIGDMPISMAHDAMATAGALRVRDMLSPRAKAQPNKLYNPNSLARGGAAFRRRWWGP